MGPKTCGARNKFGKPCARIPAPGDSRCYKHRNGLETLDDEELEALLGWFEELAALSEIETPTRDDIHTCEALWILTHAYEVIARQRAGLRSTCPTPCGLCMALDEVFRYADEVKSRTMDQKPVSPQNDDAPEDPNDESVEVL
jgi:ferredoxin